MRGCCRRRHVPQLDNPVATSGGQDTCSANSLKRESGIGIVATEGGRFGRKMAMHFFSGTGLCFRIQRGSKSVRYLCVSDAILRNMRGVGG
jgi:hypothetical protein